MGRYQAAFYHFLISLAVFIVLAYLVLVIWYPEFFFAIDGGWEGMRIIIGVDLILGPTLTLIVFRAGKPGLALDLTLIGLFQSICLMAGVFVMETVSVILQVLSFKLTGKRIFRMAPIHHHFELKGWPEPRVIVRFWIISVVLVLAGLATLKIR